MLDAEQHLLLGRHQRASSLVVAAPAGGLRALRHWPIRRRTPMPQIHAATSPAPVVAPRHCHTATNVSCTASSTMWDRRSAGGAGRQPRRVTLVELPQRGPVAVGDGGEQIGIREPAVSPRLHGRTVALLGRIGSCSAAVGSAGPLGVGYRIAIDTGSP